MIPKIIERYIADLQLKGYAIRTQESYCRAVHQLQGFCDCPHAEITEELLREFWLWAKNERGWKPSTLRISYSAIKLFFDLTIKRDWEIFDRVRFERADTLPVVLNLDEVRTLLDAFESLQNLAFFTVIYACGLRLSEAAYLQVGDIDGQRKLIHIHHGKGAKDRVVPVPESALVVLRDYYKTHFNPVWVFPARGRSGTEASTAERPAPPKVAQGALRRALKKTTIKKHVRVHTLRHSYATHLIEAGVPVRHVQEYLGHASLATVMVYLHITSHGQEDSRRRIDALMDGTLS